MSDKKEMPHFTLEVVKWEGKLHCCYLNNFRIAGSKPWAGGETVKSWPVPLRDLVQAIPELRKTAEELDAAQSQLAALREELATYKLAVTRLGGTVEKVANVAKFNKDAGEDLQQRLADAERRNSELVSAVRSINHSKYHEVFIPGDDEPQYRQRKEWVDWVLGICDEVSDINPNPEAASHDE